MNQELIELINKNLLTIYGKIKVKDITFINDIHILSGGQQVVLSIIKDSINRKMVEKYLQRTDSYYSNVIWLFDSKTKIKTLTTEEKQKNRFVFVCFITAILTAVITFMLYYKNNYIGIAIVIITVIAIVGSFIVYRKLHLFNRNLTEQEKETQIVQDNKKDFDDFFLFIHEVYNLDTFLREKKDIHDTLKIARNIVSKPDGLNKLNSNRDKYSKMITKLLEYLGMVDIYISITKLVLYDNYVLPEYIDNIYPYLEIVGDHKIKFDDNVNVLYAIGKYEKRNSFVEDIIKNIYSAQTIGVCSYSKMKYTPFSAIIDRELGEVSSVIETLDNAKKNSKYFVVLTMTREMNHYFIEQLQKLVKHKNIILILSFADVIKDLDIEKYIIKEF